MITGDWIKDIKIEILPDAYQRIARVIGIENTIRMAEVVQGVGFYFPKLDTVLAEIRNKRIREEFNGSNHKKLAIKYGVTERWVYDILAGNNIDESQCSLFESS